MSDGSDDKSNPLAAYAARIRMSVAVYHQRLAKARKSRGLLRTSWESRQEKTEEIALEALDIIAECADIVEKVASTSLVDPTLRQQLVSRLQGVRRDTIAEQGRRGGKKAGRTRRANRQAIVDLAVDAFLRLDSDPHFLKDPVPLRDIESTGGLEPGKLRSLKITRKEIMGLAEQRKIQQ